MAVGGLYTMLNWFMLVACAFALIMVAPPSVAALDTGKTSIERLNGLLDKSLKEIVHQTTVDTLSVHVGEHPDADYIRSLTISELHGHTVVEGTMSRAELLITPLDVSTRYEATEWADSLDRVITVSLKAVVTENGRSKALAVESRVDRERLHRTDALRLQSTQRSSSQAPFPARSTTLWEDILQPAIFVAAAVTTVVLLFTVRSQ